MHIVTRGKCFLQNVVLNIEGTEISISSVLPKKADLHKQKFPNINKYNSFYLKIILPLQTEFEGQTVNFQSTQAFKAEEGVKSLYNFFFCDFLMLKFLFCLWKGGGS